MPCTRNPTSSSFAASSSNTRMNSAPIRLRFSSGSVTPASRARNRSDGVDRDQRHLEMIAERRDHLRALVLAHQPVIDEHAREPVADRAVHEQCGDARVDAARQAADRPSVADLRPDALDLLLDHRARAPRSRAAADVLEEVGQHVLAVRRVHDLGVELDPVDPALDGLERRHRRRGRRRQRRESAAAPRTPCRGATSSTSARAASRRATGRAVHSQLRAAELADRGGLHLAPERRARAAASRSRSPARERRARAAPGRAGARRRRTPTPDRRKGSRRCGRRRATSAAPT